MNNPQRSDAVVVEETFNASSSMVWDAITDPEQMRAWFFDNIPSFEPSVGFQTKFVVSSETLNFTHLWKIIKVVPGTSITYHWSYEEYHGEGLVHFNIEDLGNKTRLSVTNEGLETFPENIPEFSRESCQAGWEYFIKGNLKAYIDGGDQSLR